MKLNYRIASYAAALLLPASFALAADDAKEKPRPAHESKGGTTTGKEATKTTADKDKAPATPAESKQDPKAEPRPAPEKENPNSQPRTVQESKGGTTTGKDATKTSDTTEKSTDKTKKEKSK